MGKLGNCDKTVIFVAGDSGDCDESGDSPRSSPEELLRFCFFAEHNEDVDGLYVFCILAVAAFPNGRQLIHN